MLVLVLHLLGYVVAVEMVWVLTCGHGLGTTIEYWVFFDQAICCIFRYQRLLNPKLGHGSFARQRIAYDILYQHF